MTALDPIRAEDKRVINGKADINQLAPFKYDWAWEFYLNANKNTWFPTEISMGEDKACYATLSTAEKHIYDNVFATLTTSDVMAMRNIGIAVMEKITAPEIQAYIGRQIFDEVVHTHTYQHCIENIGLEAGDIYNRYRVVPEIYAKIKMAGDRIAYACEHRLDFDKPEVIKQFLVSYMFFAGIFEGVWFYHGFTPIYALQRQNKMKRTAEQLQYIQRDESLHFQFGIKVINTIVAETGIKPEQDEIHQIFKQAMDVEENYIRYVMREPILGYNMHLHMEQAKYLCNQRLVQLGYQPLYTGVKNILPWLDEQIFIKKEKNFFENRVTEYQTGGALQWD